MSESQPEYSGVCCIDVDKFLIHKSLYACSLSQEAGTFLAWGHMPNTKLFCQCAVGINLGPNII